MKIEHIKLAVKVALNRSKNQPSTRFGFEYVYLHTKATLNSLIFTDYLK